MKLRGVKIALTIVVMMAAGGMPSARDMFFRNVSEMGDYGDLTINCISVDTVGYAWLGTDRGVLKTDGVHSWLTSVNNDNTPLFITSFAPLDNGDMAVGTRRGLKLINSKGDVAEADDPSPEITSMLKWTADTLLAGTTHGLLAYDPKGNLVEFIKFPVENIYLPQAHVTSMAADEHGDVYVHTMTSLYRLSRRDRSFTKLRDVPAWSDSAIEMAVGNGKIWVAMMSSGLWVIDSDSGNASQVEINSPVARSVCLRDGQLYVGTDGNGVKVIDTTTGTVSNHIVHELNRQGSPASNQVYRVMVAENGVMWIGYYQHGADFSVNNSGVFDVFNEPGVFNSLGIAMRTLNITPERMMLGTRDGLVVLGNDGSVVTLKRPKLNSDMVITVNEYNGKVYIGTYGGGMSVYDPSTRAVTPFDTHNEVPFNRGHVFTITVDDSNRLWLGTSNGLYCYDGDNEVAHYTLANSVLPEGNVYEVKFDSQQRGWICTENGVRVYDPITGTLRRDILPDGFVADDKIRTVYEDAEHNLYFLPERGQIVVSDFQLSNVRRLNQSALQDSDPKAIIEDGNGYIWITTNKGLVRWNKGEEFLRFGVADGLPSAQFIQCNPVVGSDGILWFGNSNGLVKLDTHRDPHNKAFDRYMVPTAVSTEGSDDRVASIECIDSTFYEIKLDRFCANLTIDFSQFTYASPNAVAYEYSLDGEQWTAMPTGMSVDVYNKFTDHDVTLLVRPSGHQDLITEVHIEMPRSMAMKVIIGLCVVAILLVGYIIFISVRLFRRKLNERRRQRELAQRVALDDEANDEEKPKYRSNPLSDAECVRVMKLVQDVMTREKLYVDPNLKISQLAQKVSISSHRLSQILSQHAGKSFYDYVNTYRVREFKRIATRRGSAKYTIAAMSEMAGFSSRASFFRHFKDVEGVSPGEYLRTVRGKNG